MVNSIASDLKPALKAGDRVINFGQLAKIIEVRPDGDFVLMSVGLSGDFSKWVGNPAKCEAAN